MNRRSIVLTGACLIAAALAVAAIAKHWDSPPDATGVNVGYQHLFRELEKSWDFERPIAAPPDPAIMLADESRNSDTG